uniref:Sphingosine-1-phosphate lyase n=1 Tax=viral metagenome TaxID=1070528 RepID=A0A6C0JEP6_9ZZZZ
MDREQGRLFLETLNSIQKLPQGINLNQIIGKYKVDKVLIALGCYYLYSKSRTYFSRLSVYGVINNIPYVNRYLKNRITDAVGMIKKEFKIVDYKNRNSLPETGMSVANIKEIALNYKGYRKFRPEDGKVSGTVYLGNEPEFNNLMIDTVREFIYSNPLHPDVFPDIRIMESEIINMVKNLFNGSSESCGNLTSGGTESILMACKAYRDYYRDNKGIYDPEIIIPESAHGSFLKAGDYFGIKMVKVPVDYNTGKVIIKKVISSITSNTICLVGSAPSFPHGVIDDIEELSDIAIKNNIGLHVDCCLGGFVLPFIKKIGITNYEFDFNLEGVTSISADPHKYGFTMKGSSIILYKNKELRKYQYFVNTDWSGGIYATPTIAGSRSGVIVATTWASLLYYGLKGYTESALNIIKLKNALLHSIMQIEDIKVIGTPATSVIALRSDTIDIYLVGSKMSEKGWNLNILQNPKAFHICLTNVHVKNKILLKFIEDLNESVTYAKINPNKKTSGTCAIYGMTNTVGDSNIIKEVTYGFLDTLTEV